MLDNSRTSTLFLDGLAEPGQAAAWAAFDRRYRPIIARVAAAAGLSEADAADAAQETLVRFVEEYRAGRYDRERGRLRAWLIALAKSRIAHILRERARRGEWRHASALVDLSDEARMAALWETELRRHLLRLALDDVRRSTRLHERTIQAFELHVLRQVPAAAVGEQLGMSAQEVYVAKGRVTARLRTTLRDLEARYEET